MILCTCLQLGDDVPRVFPAGDNEQPKDDPQGHTQDVSHTQGDTRRQDVSLTQGDTRGQDMSHKQGDTRRQDMSHKQGDTHEQHVLHIQGDFILQLFTA